jgi:hypothetical protein
MAAPQPFAQPFYVRLDESRFRATELTEGPWSREQQHGGPPSALLAGVIESTDPKEEAEVVRIALDFVAAVPVGEVEARAEVVRDGRNVQLLAGELSAGGRVCLRASAWRLRLRELGAEAPAPEEPPQLPDVEPDDTLSRFGYGRATEWRFVSGRFDAPGPAVAWCRFERPVVAGEPVTGLQRVLVPVDAASGISAAISWDEFSFPNVDLTVHLHRPPATEWVCVDARTVIGPASVGLTHTRIYDERGFVGVAAQTLFAAPARSR